MEVAKSLACSVMACSALLSGCASAEARSRKVCEKALERRLVAPSSLEVVSSDLAPMGAVTKEDVIEKLKVSITEMEGKFDSLLTADRLVLQYLKELVKKGGGDLATSGRLNDMKSTTGVLLTYDAENAFGAPIRGHFFCRVIERDDDPTEFVSFDIPVDEVPSFEASMHRKR